jgi:hypothetical protein
MNVFQSTQAFASPKNSWLPELATLVNQAKHNHLEVASIPSTVMNISHSKDGTMLMQFAPGHAPRRGIPWMKIKATAMEMGAEGSYEVVFLQLKDIKMELSTFLKEAIPGVDAIIAECRRLIP